MYIGLTPWLTLSWYLIDILTLLSRLNLADVPCYVCQYIDSIDTWPTTDQLSTECWSRCWLSVNQVSANYQWSCWSLSLEMFIEGQLTQMLLALTHDPAWVNWQVSSVTQCKSLYYLTVFLYVKFSFLCFRHNLWIIYKYVLFHFQDLSVVGETCLPVDVATAVEIVLNVISAQIVKTITAAVFMSTVFPVV